MASIAGQDTGHDEGGKTMRGKLTFANVMSVVAVFIALGGVGYAATRLPKNSVDTRQLKANAVTGAKVKNGSLSGADVNASTLGTVPHASAADSAGRAASATHADSAATASVAADADRLGGIGASGYLAAGTVQRIDSGEMTMDEALPLTKAGNLTLRASCHEGGVPENLLVIEAASSGANASIERAVIEGTGGSVVVGTEPFAVTEVPSSVFVSHSPGAQKDAVAWLIYRDDSQTITVTLRTQVEFVFPGHCSVSGTALVS